MSFQFTRPAERAATQSAFTLVELLVVIGIIALLISILLPSLNRARLSAKKTLTLSNLRQIGTGVALYQSDDSKQRLPILLPIDQDERSFLALAMLADKEQLPPEIFINPNTLDTAATEQYDATVEGGRFEGWPVLADLGPASATPATPITLTQPAVIDSTNVGQVRFHCSFAYDADPKGSNRKTEARVYLGDRANYELGRTFSANWQDTGMCLLWTDQHGEFVTKRSLPAQQDPNIFHHNEFGGEGAAEVVDDVAVVPETLDTHLRFFSEAEDDVLLPNE